MTRHKHKKSPAKLLRSLYIWHRYIGLAAAVFVILLTVTGLVLNHTEDLSLDSRHVGSDLLLDWYGIDVPDDITGYRVGDTVISAIGSQVYWNTTRIPRVTAPLLGAVGFADLVIIAVEGQLLLFTPDGELVERLGGAAGVPAGMQALGLTPAGELAIHAAHGYYRTDDSFLEWIETDNLDAVWSESAEPSPALRSALQQAWRGTGVTLERVLLDLHSGRILGSRGIYLVDAAAVLFLVLAISGVWLWGKRRATAQVHRRGKHSGR
ncbi:MAG: PepSY domain-containing protein [Thiohalobacterales bacterium]